MNVIGDVAGRTCIIQDDIIDTAGTIVKAANALKANGAERVIACAVHGVLSGPAVERLESAPIEQVVITNTIPLHSDRARGCTKIRQLSVARLLGQAIRSINEETSVSSSVCIAASCQLPASRMVWSRWKTWRARKLRKLEAEAVMAAATLKFEKRETRGKNEARRLRASGRIPAVLYGAEKGKAFEIAVDPKALLKILHSESGVNTLIGLEGLSDAGRDTRVLVKEYQLDPIDHKLLHADFYQVAMDKMLTVTVPIVLKGEAKGVKQQGGIVDFVNREVEIEVLPGDIPENITVDISELMLNQGVRVRDLPTEGVEVDSRSATPT